MKVRNTQPSSRNGIADPRQHRSQPAANPARLNTQLDSGTETAPSGQLQDSEDPPGCQASSAIDSMVEILTRGKDEGTPLAADWKEVFLEALARAPIVSVAARIAGVSRGRAMEERNADGKFAWRWDDAVDDGLDEIEAAAYLDGVYGEKKPLFHHGLQIGWAADYSGAMRSMLLKARHPEVFNKKHDPKKKEFKALTLEEFRKRVEEARRM